MFDIVVDYVIYTEFVLINTHCIAKAVRINPFIVKNQELKIPKIPTYFFLNIILMAAIGTYLLTDYVLYYIRFQTEYYLVTFFYVLFYFISSMASFFIIGIATRHVSEEIIVANNCFRASTAVATFDPLIKMFQDLKKGLSPLLFHIFFIKSIFVISYSYKFFTTRTYRYMIAFLFELLEIDYLAQIVDDTYKMFRNTSKNLK